MSHLNICLCGLWLQCLLSLLITSDNFPASLLTAWTFFFAMMLAMPFLRVLPPNALSTWWSQCDHLRSHHLIWGLSPTVARSSATTKTSVTASFFTVYKKLLLLPLTISLSFLPFQEMWHNLFTFKQFPYLYSTPILPCLVACLKEKKMEKIKYKLTSKEQILHQ